MRSSFAFLVLVFGGCSRETPVGERIEGETQGVPFVVRLAEKLPESERAEIRKTLSESLDKMLALTASSLSDSDVSRVNRAGAGVETSVTAETFALVQEAVRASELTEGAFDPTAAPLARLWGFGPGASPKDAPPTEEAIERELARVGFRHLELDDDSITLTKRVESLEVDLSALEKGHALDLAAAALDERGYKNYLLEVGADVRSRGKDAAGGPWLVPIRKPAPGKDEIQRTIPLSGFAMATASDYREIGGAEALAGKLNTHLVDPRTGRPLDRGVLSVTVVGEACSTAEATAMGLLVLGPDEGLRVAAARDLAVLFVVRSEKGGLEERASPAFAELFF